MRAWLIRYAAGPAALLLSCTLLSAPAAAPVTPARSTSAAQDTEVKLSPKEQKLVDLINKNTNEKFNKLNKELTKYKEELDQLKEDMRRLKAGGAEHGSARTVRSATRASADRIGTVTALKPERRGLSPVPGPGARSAAIRVRERQEHNTQLLKEKYDAAKGKGKNEVEVLREMAEALRKIKEEQRGKLTEAPKKGHGHFIPSAAKAKPKDKMYHPLWSEEKWRENFTHLLADRVTKGTDSKFRIIGGKPVSEDAYPDCVAIRFSNQHRGVLCTGTLIGKNLVLTAGHCVRDDENDADWDSATVFIGNEITRPKQEYAGRLLLRHPEYNRETGANDIALIVVSEDVAGVTPRRIAVSGQIDDAKALRLAGFGLTRVEDPSSTGTLHEVDVPIAASSCQCEECPGKFGCISGMEMVAGADGYDSCNGDSGGPAYIHAGGALLLAGLTSRSTASSPECGVGVGGVYVRADKHLDWITRAAAANGGKFPPDPDPDPIITPPPKPTPGPGSTPSAPDYSAEVLRRIDWWKRYYPKYYYP